MSITLEALYRQISELKQQMYGHLREAGAMEVEDCEFETADGPKRLSELFAGREFLMAIHNMGRGCVYCTTWADGLNGLLPHLESRAAVVLVSPDPPATQREFADSRGWRFRRATDSGAFARSLGFLGDHGWMPGASVLQRKPDGTIMRTGFTFFGPMDDFCPVFPLFELFPGGQGDWEPQYEYPRG